MANIVAVIVFSCLRLPIENNYRNPIKSENVFKAFKYFVLRILLLAVLFRTLSEMYLLSNAQI